MFLSLATNNVVRGNCFGLDATGSIPMGNGNTYSGFHNLEITNFCYRNSIGGENPGDGNRIACAPTRGGINYAGIRVRELAGNNLISGNAMFSNGGLGIDLQGYEVTPNDPCDIDGGANQVQNSPVLIQAVSGTALGIRGTLNSSPNQSFRIQFFASPACDALYNAGEGAIFLGAITVETDGACIADFFAALPPSVPEGYVITATATDAANNTSEFSPCAPVSLAPVLAHAVSPDGQSLVLSWAVTPGGSVLNQTDSLSAPITWVKVPIVPVVINGRNVVSVPLSNVGNQFYLLSFE
jgi:titin